MTTYAPQQGLFPGRPPCVNCGADFHLHRPPTALEAPGWGPHTIGGVTGQGLAALYGRGVALECPTAARLTDRMTDAIALLRQALAKGDRTGVFTYRGEVQRLTDHRPRKSLPGDLPHCEPCDVLLATEAL